MTIAEVVEKLKASHWSVPRPEGEAVAKAYSDGLLEDPSTMLHVIAWLLGELNRREVKE